MKKVVLNNPAPVANGNSHAGYYIKRSPRTPFHSAIRVGFFAALMGLTVHPAHSADWNQWRGNLRDGSQTGNLWPASIGEKSLVPKWETEKLGASYSGPITDGKVIFTTESTKSRESILAYGLEDGKLKWKQNWPGKMKVPFFAGRNGSWIRSTPAVVIELPKLVQCIR